MAWSERAEPQIRARSLTGVTTRSSAATSLPLARSQATFGRPVSSSPRARALHARTQNPFATAAVLHRRHLKSGSVCVAHDYHRHTVTARGASVDSRPRLICIPSADGAFATRANALL